jgi:SAM-dependent methyltransferase
MTLPDEVVRTQIAYDKTARQYAASHPDSKNVENHLRRFIRHLDGNRVLDVGCGPSREVEFFREHGIKCVGIDLNKHMIKLVRERSNDWPLVRMDMLDLGFLPMSFDGIWVCGSFYHIPKLRAVGVLLALKELLREKGLIYLALKQGDTEGMERKPEDGAPKFYARYTLQEAQELMRYSMFEVISLVIEDKKEMWINIFAGKAKTCKLAFADW